MRVRVHPRSRLRYIWSSLAKRKTMRESKGERIVVHDRKQDGSAKWF